MADLGGTFFGVLVSVVVGSIVEACWFWFWDFQFGGGLTIEFQSN